MQISKEQPMRPALDDVIDAVNDIGDIGPYVTDAVDDWLDEHPEATTTVQDNSLTTDKYQDGSVTGSKISNNAITTDKIADGAVTYDKLHEPDLLMVGGAKSVTNDEAITREYLYESVPDGAGDGLALIESVRGNTVVQDGSLLPVRMEGVETVGFNLLADASPFEMTASTYANVLFYDDADGLAAFKANLKDMQQLGGTLYWHIVATNTATTGAPVGQINLINGGSVLKSIVPNTTFSLADIDIDSVTTAILYGPSSGSTTFSDACINLSDTARNGTYEPYWRSERTIPAATYFPQGMRSVGAVRDELTATEAITRVGAVDLGTLTWRKYSSSGDMGYYFATEIVGIAQGVAYLQPSNLACARYTVVAANWETNIGDKQISKGIGATDVVMVKDSAYTEAADFKAAMTGVMLYYELATPTTTPIDPPILLSYRVGAGGTERVMVASGTTSAPPIFATRYPVNLTDLAESIAPRESTIATGNHAIGDLIMLGWTLCKATQVIVTGETIEIGTNVTKTTVAEEIAALS